MDTNFGKGNENSVIGERLENRKSQGAYSWDDRGKIYPRLDPLEPRCSHVAFKFASKLASRLAWVIDSGLSGRQIYASVIIGAAHAFYFCSFV